MTHQVSLGNNVTADFYFAGGSTCLMHEYQLMTPDVQAIETPGLSDGMEVDIPRYKNVNEVIEVSFLGATTQAVQDNVRIVSSYLATAKRRQQYKVGQRVHIRILLDGESNSWRSEVLYGKVELLPDSLQIWGNKMVRARIHITRRYYWELNGSTSIEIASQAHATPALGQANTISIANCKDGSRGNYIEILAAQIYGDLPTPIKITLKNTTGGAVSYKDVFMANNCFSDPQNFAYAIEGETVDVGFGTSTSSTTALASGAAYGNSGAFTTSGAMQWTLDNATLQDTGGRYFRVLCRFFSYTSAASIYVTPCIMDATGGLILFQGDEVLLPATSSSAVIDLGALPIPPGGYSASWLGAKLRFNMRAAISASVQVDFIQLFPVEGFKRLINRGISVANNESIVDDGTEDQSYTTLSGFQIPAMSPRGGPMYVYPGIINRIYILQNITTGANVAQTFSVAVECRPRRLSI